MKQTRKLGLIALLISGISTCIAFVGYDGYSQFHCDDKTWLSTSIYKNGAYVPFIDQNVSPFIACYHDQSNWSMGAFFGIMMIWFFYAMIVMVWRLDMSQNEYDLRPTNQPLCEIHMNEILNHFLWTNNFKVNYGKGYGQCMNCKQESIGEFVKTEKTLPKQSGREVSKE